MNAKNNFYILSTGKSMLPMLKGIEIIKIKPYNEKEILRGDIILFSPYNNSNKIIHRVIFNNNNEIKTKGDNNTKIDPWIISKDNVYGKAEYIFKKNKLIKIHGGNFGLIQSHYFHYKKKLNNILKYLIYKILIKVSKNKKINKIALDLWKIKFIKVKNKNETDLIMLTRNKSIGKFTSVSKKWFIKLPYRFFIDENTLPNQANIDN